MDFKIYNNYVGELSNLHRWFDEQYGYKEQKYRRLISLGILDDNGENPRDKLQELYLTAETNRRRIQELEKVLVVDVKDVKGEI